MTLDRLLNVFHHLVTHPVIFRNALRVLREEGPKAFASRTFSLIHGKKPYRYVEPAHGDDVRRRIDTFADRPVFSVIMPVYNVDPLYLAAAVDSVTAQWYPRWELCICDDASTAPETLEYLRSLRDPRIKITFSETNRNIAGATNEALALAEGDYVVLLDNDDTLTPDALFEIACAVNETGADFIYSDEDFITETGKAVHAHFKPDFSPDLLLSHNYITHLCAMKRSLVDRTGRFDSRFDGAQDYDYFLRATERAERIHHIPKVLYHWRMHAGSTSADADAKPEASNRAKAALENALKRRNIRGEVLEGNLPHYFRVKRRIEGEPLVSIVIPFRDKPELLETCIGSILEKSTYRRFEIIGMNNRSSEPETFETMARLGERDARVTFHDYDRPFNYSAINNHAVEQYAGGKHILLLNNDIEIISPDWIEALLEHSQRPEVGCVGAKLYYEDGTIQHAGAIIGLGGYVAHSHRGLPGTSHGYFNRLNVIQNLSAVTGACLMVERELYLSVGGLDETHFQIAYNDIDFCLRIREKGLLNVFTPYCEAYHYESKSRGSDDEDPEKAARFEKEKAWLKQRHPVVASLRDPYYNPNLTLDSEDFALR